MPEGTFDRGSFPLNGISRQSFSLQCGLHATSRYGIDRCHDPDKPCWGGTYFPKESRFGKPAFTDVLHNVARIFRDDPTSIEQNRRALMDRLAQSARPKGRIVVAAAELDAAAQQLGGLIDPRHG